MAAKGGRGKEEREGGTEKRARWRNCHGSRMKSQFWHSERVFTFPGTVAQDGKGDRGRWEDVGSALCCFWTITVNAPGCLVSHQPWKSLPYGKIGSFKNEEGKWKYKRQSAGSHYVQHSAAVINIATYSWVNNYNVIMWRGRLHTHSHVHIRACHCIESKNISFSLKLNVNS